VQRRCGLSETVTDVVEEGQSLGARETYPGRGASVAQPHLEKAEVRVPDRLAEVNICDHQGGTVRVRRGEDEVVHCSVPWGWGWGIRGIPAS
jgi:Rieske Fe-S protein